VSDESTLELVLHFYRELVTGKKDATRALREAQIKLIESEKYSSPFFWAPFIIIGNWR
jgi:CHAT domain-containing protein